MNSKESDIIRYIDNEGKEQVIDLNDFLLVTVNESNELTDLWVPSKEHKKSIDEI